MRCGSCHNEVPGGTALCPSRGSNPNASSGLANGAGPHEARGLDGFEYAAFISYRHLPRDQEVAKQVQTAIESFRMPRGVSAQGRSDRRLGKCFRDEDELAATHSLSERILEALERSSALVVVCSPDARDSLWVQREIEAFVEMHGRERVFAVLADGSSAESIPDQLRAADVEAGVGIGIGHSSPLAADLRPGAVKKSRDEMLRLVAAVAGCGFDDLKQRDRARRRKRAVAAIASIIALAVVIAGAAIFASDAHRSAQVAESQRLAAESTQLLSLGDRYGAIEKALEALPQSESPNDRPLVPEARLALEDALELNRQHLGCPWLASYEIRTDAPLGYVGTSLSREADSQVEDASVVAVSDSGGFFAISCSDGRVATYDTVTGRKLADCIMPEEAAPLDGGIYARTIGATENYVIVANGGSASVVAVFDARTGEMLNSAHGAGCPSFDTSFGGDLVSMSYPMGSGGYSVVIADVGTGAASGAEFADAEVADVVAGACFNTPGDRLGDNYSVFGNRLFFAQLDGGEAKGVTLAYPEATSLKYADGSVLVASAEPLVGDAVTRRFAIEVFDSDLQLKWRYEDSFSSQMIVENGVVSLIAGAPEIHGTIDGGSKIVASMGRKVIVLNALTGDLVETMSFDQEIAAVDLAIYIDDNPTLLETACANGVVNSKDLADGSMDPDGDARRLTLPFPIRWARFVECGDYYVLLAIPADSDNRIVSYRTDWTQDERSGSGYTLDELIELAGATLKDGGRG